MVKEDNNKIDLEFEAYKVWGKIANGVTYTISIIFKNTACENFNDIKITDIKLSTGHDLKLNFKQLEKDIKLYLKEETLMKWFCEEISDELYFSLEEKSNHG